MTLDEMRTFVRTHADADIEDAPNSSLDVYARIAYWDILARRDQWPHLVVNGSLTTVPNQSSYPLTAIAGGSFDAVTSVFDQNSIGRRLIYMTRADGDAIFGVNITTGSDTATGFTIEGDDIVLFPTPSAVRSYVVRGTRRPAPWPGASGSVPDLPESLHEAIAWYMLSSYFMAQEDTQIAGVYLREYESMVDRHVKNESMKENSARVPIMGGQNLRVPTFSRWVRGMVEGS